MSTKSKKTDPNRARAANAAEPTAAHDTGRTDASSGELFSELSGMLPPSEIAEMVGMSRATISGWINQEHFGFPKRVAGSDARPLFDARAVIAWLKQRGYAVQEDRGERVVWSVMNRFRGRWSVEVLTHVVLAVLVARKLADTSAAAGEAWQEASHNPQNVVSALARVGRSSAPTPELEDLTEISRPVADEAPELLVELIRVISLLSSSDLFPTADFILSRLTASQARSGGEHGFVGSPTSRLLASLIPRDAQTIYDPACGLSAALLEVHARLRESRGDRKAPRLIGHEINSAVLRLARQRFVLNDTVGEFTQADVLTRDPSPELRADFIVAEPPFGVRWDPQSSLADPRWSFGMAPRTSADTNWLQHAIYHLADGGRAFVITTAGPLFRTGAERAIRANLLGRGCVEAVVALPGKMVPHTSVPLVLWVLCRPGQSQHRGAVLLIDAADSENLEDNVQRWLQTDPQNWGAAQPPYALVDIGEILAADTVLTPHRWIARAEADTPTVLAAHAKNLNAFDHAWQHLRRLPDPVDLRQIPTAVSRLISIKDLLKQGVADLTQGRPAATVKARAHQGDLISSDYRIVHPRDLRGGRIETPDGSSTARSSDAHSHVGGVAPESSVVLTAPGDVLFSTMNKVHAAVDVTGGHILGNGVHRLRLNPDILDPSYVAYCLASSWNDRHQSGATIQRANARALQIPLIPIQEQHEFAAALSSVQEVSRSVQRLQALAEDSITGAVDLLYRHAPARS